ncbi:methyltransferase family protein [Streptomyces sp. NPDC000941]
MPPAPTPSQAEQSMEMLRLLSGFQQSQALYTLAKFDVATALHDGPMAVAELAKTTGTDADALGRLLHGPWSAHRGRRPRPGRGR